MNKRIRQIAELSGFFPVPDETEWDWEYRAENFRYEKFAELIAEEFSKQIIEYQPRYLTREQAAEMADTIKRHFRS